MYATRQQTAENDKNKKAQSKVPSLKAGALGQDSNAAAVQLNNRRALGDIGNLVESLSARCNINKDGTSENPPGVPAQVNRPITRRYVASLANGQMPAKPTIAVEFSRDAAAAAEASKPGPEAGQVKNTVPSSDVASNSQVATARSGHPAHLKALLKNGRAPSAKKEKKQTLTALLTARSEAACRGFDVETAGIKEPSVNIDEADIGNQLAVVDYVEDIYSFYRKTEVQSCVPSNYMSKQTDINENMRSILIDWLIEVHLKFKLMPETLFLTTNLIDRYLSCQNVSRKSLQLVGVTAMLVASKYEEIWAPEVKDFLFISVNAYTTADVLEMEKKMLNTLRFNLTVPTPYVFIKRFLKAAAADNQMAMAAFFMVELCLAEYATVKFPPSLLAAAAVYTAQSTLRRSPLWSVALQLHSGYSEEHLQECAAMMVEFHKKAGKGIFTVVHKKYSASKFEAVAALSPTTLMLGQKDPTKIDT